MSYWWYGVIGACIAIGCGIYMYLLMMRGKRGGSVLAKIGKLIQESSRIFLLKQYSTLGYTALIFALLIASPWPITGNVNWFLYGGMFLIGCIASASAGVIGMLGAIQANMRTAYQTRSGVNAAFRPAYRAGAMMGMLTVGISFLGICIIALASGNSEPLLTFFSLGASLTALFAKFGGGIFTKTADMAADLVGKCGFDMPEDDPRNPAVIADNVGDNVGDCAGMGADLADSFIAAIISCNLLTVILTQGKLTVLVILFVSLGILASMIGVLVVNKMKIVGNPTKALNTGTYLTCALFAVFSGIIVWALGFDFRLWLAPIFGLIAGAAIGFITDYYTDSEKRPVKDSAEAAEQGPAPAFLSGMTAGLLSAIVPTVIIAVAAIAAGWICAPLGPNMSVIGIGFAALGMISIVGIVVSNDAYGPIVDNAKGIAEQGGFCEEHVAVADILDSAGNTVKAITKGIAIGLAGISVVVLLFAFKEVAQAALNIDLIADLFQVEVAAGALIGACMPVMFSAFAISAVRRNAARMIDVIAQQLREKLEKNPHYLEGKPDFKNLPDYKPSISIATSGAQKNLVGPSLLTVVATLLVYIILGPSATAGFILGAILVGLVLALFMANAGGNWDNAKKVVEGKKPKRANFATDEEFNIAYAAWKLVHNAAVAGDIVGDPLKDTAGPSLNTQITVINLVAINSVYIFGNPSSSVKIIALCATGLTLLIYGGYYLLKSRMI